jgi:hypothetical protein
MRMSKRHFKMTVWSDIFDAHQVSLPGGETISLGEKITEAGGWSEYVADLIEKDAPGFRALRQRHRALCRRRNKEKAD